jgi:hypothetical protein
MDYYAYKKVNDEDGIINAGKSNQSSEGAKGKIVFKNFQILTEKRKRRSKHVQEGRVFECECGKSYLSLPALNNHKNTKHRESEKTVEKRPRGRPRKYVNN